MPLSVWTSALSRLYAKSFLVFVLKQTCNTTALLCANAYLAWCTSGYASLVASTLTTYTSKMLTISSRENVGKGRVPAALNRKRSPGLVTAVPMW